MNAILLYFPIKNLCVLLCRCWNGRGTLSATTAASLAPNALVGHVRWDFGAHCWEQLNVTGSDKEMDSIECFLNKPAANAFPVLAECLTGVGRCAELNNAVPAGSAIRHCAGL